MGVDTPLVWIVDSAYTGELHARLGVAEQLGYGHAIIPLPNDDAGTYARLLEDRYDHACRDGEPRPVILLSGTGEDTIGPIADLKGMFHGRLLNVYLASILPDELDLRLQEYDLVASPQLSGANVVTTVGVVHRMTDRLLDQAFHRHRDVFAGLTRPLVGLLVGGNTRYCFGFHEDHARCLGRRVTSIITSLQGSLVVTNSRRTPNEALAALLNEIASLNCRFFDWQQADSYLYPALLAHGDLFIATGDSVSMCSEASYTGKPLLVDINDCATEIYHRHIIGKLIAYGAAKPLSDTFQPWTYTPPDPTGAVVSAIRERLLS
ncbi:ELM1/GtrOC1 family putative glycosyltransferase [Candidatus Methylomirabilis sp.]|uniref:ELM1/GtrOC1 family putative glycosyltransferase n=1 Tax=Candidatus Methylomirabilis sp. TaxID=2032687 RepID=UPI002A65CE1C|nr:ELM1/GtrOC1 family putative glycosyltransferase [Candidatus Methylomirabilis sp.]